MPYIKVTKRNDLMPFVSEPHTPQSAGELAFCIQRSISTYLDNVGLNGNTYGDYATVTGVLETIKLELYRRRVALYEDEKIKENGDVEW